MSKTIFSLFFIVCLFSGMRSQDASFVLNGKVVDAATKMPIKNVSITVKGTLNGVLSDSLGAFSFLIPATPASLHFSMLGYEKKTIGVGLVRPTDTLQVELNSKANELQEVQINAQPMQVVSRSKRFHVLDYAFYQEHILMITYVDYPKTKLVLISRNSDTLGFKKIPYEPNRLFKDCLGNVHVVCKDSIYQVHYSDRQLRLLPGKSIADFEKILLPCVAKDSSGFYLVEKYGGGELIDVGIGAPLRTNNLALRYVYVDKKKRQRSPLLLVADEHKMVMKADEADFEARKTASGLKSTYDRLFAESLIFTEVYSPLFNLEGHIYVFDYVNGKIVQFGPDRKPVKEVPVDWHKNLAFQEDMQIDETFQKAYVLFESGGISELKEINLQTGRIEHSYRLPFSFLTQIKVDRGYAYFIRKEKGDDQTRYLLRMRLE